MNSTQTVPENAMVGEGHDLREALTNGAAKFGLSADEVEHRLDLAHFRNSEGRSIGAVTVKAWVWPKDPGVVAVTRDTREWWSELLRLMNMTGNVSTTCQGLDVTIFVRTDQAPHLVGKGGGTLDAVRTLLLAILGRQYPEHRFRIEVDALTVERPPREMERSDDRGRERRGDAPRSRGGERERPERGRSDDRGRRDDRRRGRDEPEGERRRPERGADVPESRRVDEKKLQRMAQKVGTRVAESGKPELIRMELNSFARRVVHMAVAEIGGLRTESVGDGSHKRVRVLPEHFEESAGVAFDLSIDDSDVLDSEEIEIDSREEPVDVDGEPLE